MAKNHCILYVTLEKEEVLKRHFLYFRFSEIVSIQNLLDETGWEYENLTDEQIFILNETIKSKISRAVKRKSIFSVFYVNPWLNYEVIKNLHDVYKEDKRIKKIAFLDYKDNSKGLEYWQFFSEVVFFPTVKKQKILECEKLVLN